MDQIVYIVLVALISGVGGTGIGGVLGSLFHTSSDRAISLLLSATSGVMIAIVLLELIPESVEAGAEVFEGGGVFVAGIALVVGVVVVMVLNRVIDTSTRRQVKHTAEEDHPDTHDNIDELMHVDHYNEHARQKSNKQDLWSAGVVIACAIALHNIPEGMSVGASFAIDSADSVFMGLMLAVLIGLHNIPEGMAVAVPLIAGGMGRLKAILLTAASGAPMAIGAVLGLLIGDIGPLGLSCSLGFASGAMLYVVFAEIVPQSILMYRSKVPAFFMIAGILLGMCLIYL